MQITSLSLSAFRNYTTLSLGDLPGGLIALVGPNGAGKTNILEAISMLSPGRGLRSADLPELQSRDLAANTSPWGIHARLIGRYGPQDMGVGLDPVANRRLVRLNGEPMKSSSDRADLMRCVWLTPTHDRLFVDAASARRKLLDRWIFSADPAHAGRTSRMERLISERNRLLAADRADPLWLDALENDLSETGLAIAVARTDYIERLRAQIEKLDDPLFPHPDLHLSGFLEDRIGHEPALQIEQDYRDMLRANRPRDKAIEATSVGPHRSDLIVTYRAKKMPARECSTGEQKALLFALFLSHARLLRTEAMGDAPILLLDEITAHLDPARRDALLTQLSALAGQVFMTATTAEPFMSTPSTTIIEIEGGTIKRRQQLHLVKQTS